MGVGEPDVSAPGPPVDLVVITGYSGAGKTELGGLDVLIADWAARYLGR